MVIQQEKRAIFRDDLLQGFSHEPTACQREAIEMLSDYLFEPAENVLFLLKGYAGTGKTTLISAFVKVLESRKIKNRLLAPTGRAAKVLGAYAGKPAHTIHRFIYQVFTSPDGSTLILPRQNKSTDTVYIVDEVSMISGFETPEDESQPFANRNILDDLIRFVYSADNCRMIFIGDQAQLPPVGTAISPALNVRHLTAGFNLSVISHTLEEVVRQEAGSGILTNATEIRRKIGDKDLALPFLRVCPGDVVVANGQDLLDEMEGAFNRYDQNNAVIITRSNKRANQYNQEVRRRILYREEEIEGGDLMMVVKNNYFWLPENSPAGFVANGDLIEIIRIRNVEERYGFRFADALIRLAEDQFEMELEVKLLLSAIQSESASLSRNDQIALFHAVREEISSAPESEKKGGVSKHPYYNALQVKFAYALTCHKTQGGQWDIVFLDQGWLPEERIDSEYFRWIYTAVTRATRKIFLMGFNPKYVKDDWHEG